MRHLSIKYCALSLVFAILWEPGAYGMKRTEAQDVEDVVAGMVRDIDIMSSALEIESTGISASFDQKIIQDTNWVAGRLVTLNQEICVAEALYPSFYETVLNIGMYERIACLVRSVEGYLFAYKVSLLKKREAYRTGYKRFLYSEEATNGFLAKVEKAAVVAHQKKEKLKETVRRIYTAGQQRQQEFE